MGKTSFDFSLSYVDLAMERAVDSPVWACAIKQ